MDTDFGSATLGEEVPSVKHDSYKRLQPVSLTGEKRMTQHRMGSMEDASYPLQGILSIKMNKLEKGLIWEVMRINAFGILFASLFVDLLKSNVCHINRWFGIWKV